MKTDTSLSEQLTRLEIFDDSPKKVVLEGKEYILRMGERGFSITTDDIEEHIFFHCILEYDDTLSFHISTKNSKTGEPAPGLFASELVGLSFRYFEKQGRNIKVVESYWVCEDYNDNYKAYKLGLEHGLSKEEAARQTWTGRTLAKHGFTNITVLETDKDVISVLFKKEN